MVDLMFWEFSHNFLQQAEEKSVDVYLGLIRKRNELMTVVVLNTTSH